MSIHGIALKNYKDFPFSAVFSQKQIAFILCLSIIILRLITYFWGAGYKELFVSINVLFAFIFMCNIILGQNLQQGKNGLIKQGNYYAALKQLQQEEWLKTEFAAFLHDDVLQDFLSIFY